MSDAEELAQRLHTLADAAARRRQSTSGTPEYDETLAEMVRIQHELHDRPAPAPSADEDDGGAISTPPPWHTPDR
jgi:hypothetical protein